MPDVEGLPALQRLGRQHVQVVLFGHLVELRTPHSQAGRDLQRLRKQDVPIGAAGRRVDHQELTRPRLTQMRSSKTTGARTVR